MRRYPHAFSGGQRQRIGIARALALNPSWSSPTSRSRRSTCRSRPRSSTCSTTCRREFGLTYLFVSHDLSVVEHICDRVAVMYVGKIVELAPTEELFTQPLHPYTEALLSAVPKPDPRQRASRIVLEGEVADPANPPPGCAFPPALPVRGRALPDRGAGARGRADGRLVAVIGARELTLRGIGVAA